MELTLEEIPTISDNLADIMETGIPSDSKVITVKVDLPDDYDIDKREAYDFHSVLAYVTKTAGLIIACSGGLHLNGKAQKPHIHYHFITDHFVPPSNPSQHRQRFCAKEGGYYDLSRCSFKYQNLDNTKPKYSILSYPLKEGLKIHDKKVYIYDGERMPQSHLNFLMEVGKAIYDKEYALNLRKDKCEERKKVALCSLAELCKNNASQFKNYNEMVIWLDTNYIANLSLEEYPDPKNYKTNCQKIAVNLGKLKYSDIV